MYLENVVQLCQLHLSKLAPLALSFADDLLVIGLSRLGISLPGIAWIGPLLLTVTLLFWLTRLIHYGAKFYERQRSGNL